MIKNVAIDPRFLGLEGEQFSRALQHSSVKTILTLHGLEVKPATEKGGLFIVRHQQGKELQFEALVALQNALVQHAQKPTQER